MTISLAGITATIVDLPTRRPHGFSTTTMSKQSLVIVRARTHDGLEGIGEGVTPGGPWWAGESVETIKLMVDTYLAPAVVALTDATPGAAAQAMDRVAARNLFAKAAVDMALWDLAGKSCGRSIAALLGGALRSRIPITWALSAADTNTIVAEAEVRADEGYRAFKFKMGALPADEDVARVTSASEKISDPVSLVVDPNGAWDEHTAACALGELARAGIGIAEQPVPGWNLDGLSRLRAGTPLRLMADESAQTPQDIVRIVSAAAADSVSLKIPKAGGIGRAGAMAQVAAAGGVALYGGSTLESSLGAAASAQLYSTWPDLIGCELVGPRLLVQDVVTEPMRYDDGALHVPNGPGLGVELDEDKVTFHARS